ncbi:cupin domain-containing protein (plasmid) [Deinococcus sp. KNUC1210]|uniref:cupin domain-containing protein n=1 Tax=Deinococcus sp. KNUC1210 TaxID=2917691 RepID=UPI001EEF8AF2|nr:cupin domain-containing protein [Deinococcus sp. KNUC1210]ULH17818.1 cupin domain-containing protein [Deinococcus sp. KNUC1210]
MNATLRSWNGIHAAQPAPGVTRRYVSGEQATVAQFELNEGAVIAWHAHANEQISVVLAGCLRFEFGSAEAPDVMEAHAGDSVVIPGHLPHQVTVIEDARAIDVFAPPRADWMGAVDV